MMKGKSKLTWTDGSSYDGEWQRNEPHGWGTWQTKGDEHTPPKLKYVGFWENGKKHGKGGKFVYGDGSQYEGDYEFDLRHGHGVFTWPAQKEKDQGERKYDGQWQEGKQHGTGKFTLQYK